MNYFFSIKNDFLKSRLTIPRFQNNSYKNNKFELFSAKIENNQWSINKINTNIVKDFYILENDSLDNNKIFFLAKEKEVLKTNQKNNLKYLNNFTKTEPAFRANLKIYNKYGGFSSYQSDYPFKMITKKGNIISPLSSLTNIEADCNIIFFKNIFHEPVNLQFYCFFIDISKNKIVNKIELFTNKTNEVVVDKKYINSDTFFFTKNFLGIPIFASFKNNHISFEHTHPQQEYVLSKDKYKVTNQLKEKINEITT